MENETIIRLCETAYQVSNVTYDYDEEYDFYVYGEVRLPPNVAPEDGVLSAAFKLDFILKSAEKNNPGMAKYIKSTLESSSNVDSWHKVAFETMEDEGFDLEQLLRYSVDEMEIKFVKLD